MGELQCQRKRRLLLVLSLLRAVNVQRVSGQQLELAVVVQDGGVLLTSSDLDFVVEFLTWTIHERTVCLVCAPSPCPFPYLQRARA